MLQLAKKVSPEPISLASLGTLPAGFLPLSEIRQTLGLYADTSQDELLKEYLRAALEKVEQYSGKWLIERQIHEYFLVGNRYRLSTLSEIQEGSVILEVVGDSIFRTISQVDSTGPQPEVSFEVTTDSTFRYPIKLSYTPIPSTSETLVQGVLYWVQVLYEEKVPERAAHTLKQLLAHEFRESF